jgi:hypothetical protein
MAEIGGRAGQTYILLARFIGASAEGLRKTGQFEEALLEQMRSGDAG